MALITRKLIIPKPKKRSRPKKDQLIRPEKIDFNSFINIRPNQGNDSNEIQDVNVRNEFEKLMKYFFTKILR